MGNASLCKVKHREVMMYSFVHLAYSTAYLRKRPTVFSITRPISTTVVWPIFEIQVENPGNPFTIT